MVWCWFLAMIYVAAVLDTSFAHVWAIGPVAPLAMVAAALSAVLVRSSHLGRFAAGGVGLLADILTPGRLGLGMVSFFLGAWFVWWVQRRFGWRHPLLRATLVVPVATIYAAASIWLNRPSAPLTRGGLGDLLGQALGVGLYTAAISVPCVMVLAWQHDSDAENPLAR